MYRGKGIPLQLYPALEFLVEREELAIHFSEVLRELVV